jgi:hypothetical protein
MPDVRAYHLYVQRYEKILIFGILGVFTPLEKAADSCRLTSYNYRLWYKATIC